MDIKDNKLKEEFIKYFGEEKWNEEEMLEEIMDFQIYVANYLNIDLVPVIVEDIPEDSRLYIKENYIAISKNIINDKIEVSKALAHEMKHIHQLLLVASDLYHPFKEEWKNEFQHMSQVSTNSSDEELANYVSGLVEIDAFAFQNFIVGKYYNVILEHPNKEYEKILKKYSSKMFE